MATRGNRSGCCGPAHRLQLAPAAMIGDGGRVRTVSRWTCSPRATRPELGERPHGSARRPKFRDFPFCLVCWGRAVYALELRRISAPLPALEHWHGGRVRTVSRWTCSPRTTRPGPGERPHGSATGLDATDLPTGCSWLPRRAIVSRVTPPDGSFREQGKPARGPLYGDFRARRRRQSSSSSFPRGDAPTRERRMRGDGGQCSARVCARLSPCPNRNEP